LWVTLFLYPIQILAGGRGARRATEPGQGNLDMRKEQEEEESSRFSETRGLKIHGKLEGQNHSKKSLHFIQTLIIRKYNSLWSRI